MKIDVYNGQTKGKSVEVKSIIGEKSDAVVYQAVVARLSHDREGNANTLTKSEVRGGGKKPWKQKGLARARAGSSRSPLWRGGGVTFGPKKRDFSKALNRKQRYKAYISVFTSFNEAGKLKVIAPFKYDAIKTKEFVKLMSTMVENNNEKLVLIVKDYNKNLYLSSRNVPNVSVHNLESIDLLPMFYADRILITEDAFVALDERFGNTFKVGE